MASILIVDDEESLRELIREVLASDGDHVYHLAANGKEAVDIIRKKTVDLAIVDRNMPGMSGIDVVALIRQNPKTARIKILMCTGSSVIREVDEAFSAGADDYLLKPLNFTQLLDKVAQALAATTRNP